MRTYIFIVRCLIIPIILGKIRFDIYTYIFLFIQYSEWTDLGGYLEVNMNCFVFPVWVGRLGISYPGVGEETEEETKTE